MIALWKKMTAAVPSPFLPALLLAGGFLGFVAWDQSHWWRVKEDYSFGWLVPLFVAFAIHDRWERIIAGLAACAADGSPRAAGWQKWLLRIGVGAALLCGALMFLLGAFYRAGAGTSQPGTLAITMGAVAIVLTLLFVNSPEAGSALRGTGVSRVSSEPGQDARATSIFSDARVKLTALFLFPAMVWLVSAPMVSAVETQLNLALLRYIVTVVAGVFEVLGLPLEQQGNVLALPMGNVGVEDACSGIRSLTGCLFAGSFLAAIFLEKLWKKIALVSAALVLALITNLCRSLFLTAWAYRYGPRAIEGTVHDTAGYAVLGLTVVGLLCLLPLFNLKFDSGDASPAAPPPAS
jgi:exosortase/archaeosortase family protein